MTKFVAMMFVVASLGCGLWSGQAYGFPDYVPPAAYGASGYGGGYGGYFVPPPPPEDMAFVNGHGYPGFWGGSSRARYANGTDWYVHVRMDGGEISFVDQYVGLPPLIPPRQDAFSYVAFDNTDPRTGCEEHHFEFDAYTREAVMFWDPQNPPRPVVQSDRYVIFCAGWEEQRVQIGQ